MTETTTTTIIIIEAIWLFTDRELKFIVFFLKPGTNIMEISIRCSQTSNYFRTSLPETPPSGAEYGNFQNADFSVFISASSWICGTYVTKYSAKPPYFPDFVHLLPAHGYFRTNQGIFPLWELNIWNRTPSGTNKKRASLTFDPSSSMK